MKLSQDTRRYLSATLIAFALASGLARAVHADPSGTVYEPGMWSNYEPEPACEGQWHVPKTGLYTTLTYYGDMPTCGYPLLGTLFAGLNDTVEVSLDIHNRTDTVFHLSGLDLTTWFIPTVYESGGGLAPVAEAKDLGWRIRYWYNYRGKMAAPTKIDTMDDGYLHALIDIWNIPRGHNYVCLSPSKNLPPGLYFVGGGLTYEYYPPYSGKDSTNAYERCFWRATRDSNYVAAKFWADKIITLNPHSVPGWWVRAVNYGCVGDTANAKKALDKALDYLANYTDPLLPNPNLRPLQPVEDAYLVFCKRRLQERRAHYGP